MLPRSSSLRVLFLSSLVSAMGFTARIAAAEPVPAVHVARHIVLPENVLRIDAGHHFPYYDGQFKHVVVRGGDDQQYVNPGVSYGIGSDVEVGLVLPIQISPDGHLRDPRAHVAFQFHEGEVEAGVIGILQIGLWDGTNTIAGVPLYWHASPDIRLDTGGYLKLSFNDGSQIGLILPAQLPIQISSEFFAGPEAIFTIGDLSDPGARVDAGGFFGYTLEASDASVVDLYARIRALNLTDGVPAVEMMLGLEWHFAM